MTHDVLILGAGLAGLKAACDLHAAGRSVLVLDKGRGVGGRAATRRWDGVPADHGAQFFTARSTAFLAQVEDWLQRGVCFEWATGFHRWDLADGLQGPDLSEGKTHPRYSCRAGMSALAKNLAAGLPEGAIRLGARVDHVIRTGDEWTLSFEGMGDDEMPPAGRTLLCTLPMPQALALFEQSDALSTLRGGTELILRGVNAAPALAVMVRGVVPASDWKGIQLHDETLAWIGDDSSKREPGADAAGRRTFVLHAGEKFSRTWQDRDLNEAASLMIARAGEVVGDWMTHLPDRQVHRWRYASVPSGIDGMPCLRARETPLYFAGDTFLGSKIEGAWCSGQAAAAAILREL